MNATLFYLKGSLALVNEEVQYIQFMNLLRKLLQFKVSIGPQFQFRGRVPVSLGLLCDLSQVSDCLNYENLVNKLTRLGFDDYSSYLSKRKQFLNESDTNCLLKGSILDFLFLVLEKIKNLIYRFSKYKTDRKYKNNSGSRKLIQ